MLDYEAINRSELKAAMAHIAELEAALKPLADLADSFEGERASFVVASKGGVILSVYDLRHARDVLKTTS
jgi:hypothetical protein